jgi:hypothetical protein
MKIAIAILCLLPIALAAQLALTVNSARSLPKKPSGGSLPAPVAPSLSQNGDDVATVVNNDSHSVSAYKWYASTTIGGTFVLDVRITTSSFDFTGDSMLFGEFYKVTVIGNGVNTSGESPPSNIVDMSNN